MKHLLTLAFLSIFGLTHAQVPSYVPTNGLVGWWPFNGNANDESGNGNNGTVNGASLTTDRFGVVNKAYSFDGVDDFIEIPNSNSISITGDISLCAWVKTNGQNNLNYQTIISKRETYWTWEYNMTLSYHNNVVHNTKLIGSRALGMGIQEQGWSFTPYLTNVWEQWVVIFKNNQIAIYKNGNLDCLQNFSLIPVNQNAPLLFGKNLLGDVSEQFNGSLDDIGIWNRALTECEIKDLYNSQLGSANTSSSTTQTAIDSYTWPVNNQTYTQSGIYTDTLVNAAGCDSIITLNLELDFTGIQTSTLPSLKLYPNPVQDVLHIDGLVGKEFEYEVLSIDGKLLQNGKSQGEISVKELRKGNYVLRVGQQQVSFVKQ